MLEDVAGGKHLQPEQADPESFERIIRERCKGTVSYPDWRLIDEAEIKKGRAVNRPRIKFSSTEAMLAALERNRTKRTPG